MRRRAIVLAWLLLGTVPGVAYADDAPAADDAAADPASTEIDVEQIRDVYQEHLRHRLPGQLNAVLDGAFALYDLRELRTALPEMWRELRDDPTLRAIFGNLKQQYKPRLDYTGYAGGIAQSTRYAGLAVGVEADITAPLCRYLGGAFNGHLYTDRVGSGVAYDSRVTGCLPWGPFAIELGFTSQRSVRMALASAPTSRASTFDSLGFELRIRGFRWIEPTWEIVTLPTDVAFVDLAPATNDNRESAHFTIDSAFIRYIRYGQGTAGSDRIIEGFPIRVVGEQDVDGAMLSATVVGFGAVALTGIRVGDGVYLDANAMFQQGSIGPAVEGAEREVSLFSGSVDTTVHVVREPYRSHVRYHRGLIPDAEFRLLSDDRVELGVSRTVGATTLGATTFAAYTRTVGTATGVMPLDSAATYGARLEYGYALYGPLYLTVRGEGARSFYADIDDLVLAEPAHELRLTAAIAASASSVGR